MIVVLSVGFETIGSGPVVGENGPIVGGPGEGLEIKIRTAVSAIFRGPGVGIVVMVGEEFLAVGGNDAHVTGAGEFAGTAEEKRAATIDHLDTIPVQIRSGHGRTAPNADIVGAVDAGAA